MEQKQCIGKTGCGIYKNIDQFELRADTGKPRGQCKECRNKYLQKYQEEHKEEIADNKKQYAQDHKEENKIYNKKYREEHKEEIAENKKQWYEEYKEEILSSQKENYKLNREPKLKKNKIYREKNKEKKQIYNNKYKKLRRQKDPIYKLRENISRSINIMLKLNGSSKACQSILKYLSPNYMADLKVYIESLWEPWMNWENHGTVEGCKENDPTTWTWQIDHIIPHSSFKYQTMDCQEFRDCWALNNLRPLFSLHNLQKGNKYNP